LYIVILTPIVYICINVFLYLTEGYGSTVVNQMRKWFGTSSGGSEFPLTLGRDFSGVVKQTGHGVSRYKPGDEVRYDEDFKKKHVKMI
jgi:hypothetical protein